MKLQKQNNEPELYLASQSPRRQELLKRCIADFRVETAPVKEINEAGDLHVIPRINASMKAAAVAKRHRKDFILGADTLVICGKEIMGKPADPAEASAFLRKLSGRTHEVVTGLALICLRRNIHLIWSESSQVTFKELSDADIEKYLSEVDVLDKAGAYAIQEHGDMLVSNYTGELENIIGLPLVKLQEYLAEFFPPAEPENE
ncbi:MAG: septum formation protein Maf [Lentisphaeria bacterium]|nr:septum formation protein Maf [Lentisphaeria bacterium]